MSKNGVNTCPPQFRSNLFCSEINSNHDCQCLNGSLSSKQIAHRIPILPLGKGYKCFHLLLRWHFSCSIHAFSLAQEHIYSAAAIAALSLSRVSKIQVQGPSPPAMASISEIPEVRFPSSSVAFVFHPLPIPSVVFLISAFIFRI